MTSPDLTQANIDKLAELFPSVVTETADDDGTPKRAIDFDLLRQELSGHVVEGPQERYQLDWPGKRAAAFSANVPIAKTLRPVREESVDFEDARNIFIEGDNLEALKLLQESYLGKVKVIYIDPPYNTGSDFVYSDRFNQTTREHLVASGQLDNEGGQLVANPESSGRFHTNWLNMMYPRLKLSRNLLKDDGVLVVSIDDDELPRLRQMLDEVFGPDNFYACVTWQKKYSPANDAKRFSDVHDYLLFYSRSSEFVRNLFPRTAENNKPYRHDDNDGRGLYRTDNLSVRTYNATNDFPIQNPNTGEWYTPPSGRCWMSNRDRILELIDENRVFWGADGLGAPQLKRYLSEVQQGTVPITLWTHDFAGHTDQARKEIRQLFGTTAVFDTPKPSRLIQRVLEVATSPSSEDIVMDFFAGSGTTAQAVLEKNAADDGNRRFILVQLNEVLKADVEFATVSEVARARIKKVSKRLKETHPNKSSNLGYRSFTIDTTNRADVFKTPEMTSQLSLDSLEASIKPDRTAMDLLFQVMLDEGLDLSLSLAVNVCGDTELYSVDGDALLACFSDHVTEATVREIAERRPLRAVFKDSGFATDAERINAHQIFREISPMTEVRAL